MPKRKTINLSMDPEYKTKLVHIGVQMQRDGKPVTDQRGYVSMSAVVRQLVDEYDRAADRPERKRGER